METCNRNSASPRRANKEHPMRLTVLMDNNTLLGRYFLAEPALSLHITEGETSLLFDTGYSEATLHNASRLDVDLLGLDNIVLSHSHLDHTWGLAPLARLYSEAILEGRPRRKPVLVTHPETFGSRLTRELGEIGPQLCQERTSHFFPLTLTTDPIWLTDRLVFLGGIPRNTDFEAQVPIGKARTSEGSEDCFVPEDSALVYKSEKGLVVITGCSHAGICNTIRHAQQVCNEEQIADVIGGLHLQNPSSAQLQGTLDFMRQLKPTVLHPCHCTDLASKIALADVAPVKEVGVGLRLTYEE
jgi:7,8-dihydropterin-6-yl-methyl-4-(beta-D-ribofuranosyl)aminobenzene 5'-phosphate synthase